MAIIENFRTIRARLAKATSSITGDIAALRDQIRAKSAELKRLASAPAPRADIAARIHELVERTGSAWLEHERSFIVSRLGSPAKGPVVPWLGNSDAMPWAAFCAADPAQAEKLLGNLIAQVEYDAGPAMADRPALTAKLEAEIADLESGEEALVDEAAAAGVSIEHRPEVMQRRAQEARKAELDAQAVADREARQNAVNETHRSRVIVINENARSRVGHSQYLAASRVV